MKNYWLDELASIKYWENLGIYVDFSSVEDQSDSKWPDPLAPLESYGYYINGVEVIAPTRDFSI